ncbi:MAG: DUF4397 domain-containing protein [Pseudomonadota bacterium]
MRNGFLSFLIAGVALLAGCDRDQDSPTGPNGTISAGGPLVGFVHAVADAPPVTLQVGGSTIFSGIPFKSASYAGFNATSGDAVVTVNVPGMMDPVEVFGPAAVSINDGQKFTIIAIGTADNITPIILDEARPNIATTQTQVRVIHGSPDAPMVDVYVEAPGTDITGATPLGTIMFGDTLGPVTITPGDYQISVTPAGDNTTVVFDSGTVTFTGGEDLFAIAVNNTTTGDSPISLLLSDEQTGFATEVLNEGTPADVRVVHASPDAPNVDVFAGMSTTPVFSNLAYTDVTMYESLMPGMMTQLRVTATGTTMPAVIDETLNLAEGFSYTVFAGGLLEDIAPIVFVDDNRSVSTEARVRIIHASPSAGDVDIFVVEPGTDITMPDEDGEDIAPNFAGVAFEASTGYVSLEPGMYDVIVTAEDDEDRMAVIGPATITVEAGGIYTAAARDAAGGGAPFGLILFDDFE